jgi:hypothetical protein
VGDEERQGGDLVDELRREHLRGPPALLRRSALQSECLHAPAPSARGGGEKLGEGEGERETELRRSARQNECPHAYMNTLYICTGC